MITGVSFVDDLVAAVLEVGDTIGEHLEDQEGELLLHLL